VAYFYTGNTALNEMRGLLLIGEKKGTAQVVTITGKAMPKL